MFKKHGCTSSFCYLKDFRDILQSKWKLFKKKKNYIAFTKQYQYQYELFKLLFIFYMNLKKFNIRHWTFAAIFHHCLNKHNFLSFIYSKSPTHPLYGLMVDCYAAAALIWSWTPTVIRVQWLFYYKPVLCCALVMRSRFTPLAYAKQIFAKRENFRSFPRFFRPENSGKGPTFSCAEMVGLRESKRLSSIVNQTTYCRSNNKFMQIDYTRMIRCVYFC